MKENIENSIKVAQKIAKLAEEEASRDPWTDEQALKFLRNMVGTTKTASEEVKDNLRLSREHREKVALLRKKLRLKN